MVDRCDNCRQACPGKARKFWTHSDRKMMKNSDLRQKCRGGVGLLGDVGSAERADWLDGQAARAAGLTAVYRSSEMCGFEALSWDPNPHLGFVKGFTDDDGNVISHPEAN